MIQRLRKEGDDYLLVIDSALAEQAGLGEGTTVEVTTTGSAIVISPVPAQPGESSVKRAEDQEDNVLRHLAE